MERSAGAGPGLGVRPPVHWGAVTPCSLDVRLTSPGSAGGGMVA